ncbi:alpha/beta fold hydrolase [Nocardia mangyaensis]|uniref:alpha/beta fold hydrolase n=1 Tax=Nocardia mangyaensis TaxID=2213200 RepID=UPI002675639A|nr:alpha/beta fold hydrolase [Nocardia mangyaensis]MDO3648233.1 alpha/beta fold hydrolase [Nocardia mangyaensis]
MPAEHDRYPPQDAPAVVWQHRSVLANGIHFHLVEAGSGPLVVLLHGFPQSWYSWRHQIPALAQHFRVVAVDMRGYGGTDRPSAVADYRVTALTSDVAALIHTLGEEKAHVVGHDWGGIVAWAFAVRYPEMVDRLGLLNYPDPVLFAKALRSNPRQLMRSWYMFFFQLPWLPELTMRRREGIPLVSAMFRDMAVCAGTFTEADLTEYRRNILAPGAASAMINYYRAAFRYFRTLHRADPVTAPTMVVWAENDIALGNELTRDLPGRFSGPFRIEYVPDSSHWVHEEHPALVSRLLSEHLRA